MRGFIVSSHPLGRQHSRLFTLAEEEKEVFLKYDPAF
jgi:hypothetical protein